MTINYWRYDQNSHLDALQQGNRMFGMEIQCKLMGALFKAQYKTGIFVCMLKITDIHKKKIIAKFLSSWIGMYGSNNNEDRMS